MKVKLLSALVVPTMLAGCASGYATDWFRDSSSIITPQLIRYGLDVEQSRCVSQRLGARLQRLDIRRLQEAAAAVRPTTAVTLTPANLRAIASGVEGGNVRGELDGALGACSVAAAPATIAATTPAAPATGATTGTSGTGPAMSGGIPIDTNPITPTAPAGGPSTWLNLGAAQSGQSIAIDAMSIQQEGATRTAWFRMTDPDNGGATNNAYRLRIDCQARTIQPLALRQTDANGVETSLRQYSPAEAVAGPAESGTVLEIAFISMCT